MKEGLLSSLQKRPRMTFSDPRFHLRPINKSFLDKHMLNTDNNAYGIVVTCHEYIYIYILDYIYIYAFVFLSFLFIFYNCV